MESLHRPAAKPDRWRAASVCCSGSRAQPRSRRRSHFTPTVVFPGRCSQRSSLRPISRCLRISPNAAHVYVLPLALLVVGFVAGLPAAMAGALIWIAHIGFDRALGYGLKYATGFGDTHLGRIGRR